MYQLEGIATLIQNAGIATLGTDLFLYHAPAEIEQCIILYPSNDPPMVDPDTPRYFQGKFQTIVRQIDYQPGFDICKRLDTALTVFNKDTPLMFIKSVRPLYPAKSISP
jgi:hypothetical protein